MGEVPNSGTPSMSREQIGLRFRGDKTMHPQIRECAYTCQVAAELHGVSGT